MPAHSLRRSRQVPACASRLGTHTGISARPFHARGQVPCTAPRLTDTHRGGKRARKHGELHRTARVPDHGTQPVLRNASIDEHPPARTERSHA